jgi:hypothetical protein
MEVPKREKRKRSDDPAGQPRDNAADVNRFIGWAPILSNFTNSDIVMCLNMGGKIICVLSAKMSAEPVVPY